MKNAKRTEKGAFQKSVFVKKDGEELGMSLVLRSVETDWSLERKSAMEERDAVETADVG